MMWVHVRGVAEFDDFKLPCPPVVGMVLYNGRNDTYWEVRRVLILVHVEEGPLCEVEVEEVMEEEECP